MRKQTNTSILSLLESLTFAKSRPSFFAVIASESLSFESFTFILISKQLSNSIMFIHTNIHQITLKKKQKQYFLFHSPINK